MNLPDSYEELLAQADELAETGNLPEANKIYRRIVTRLSRLAPTTLEKRPDLQQLLVGAAFQAHFFSRVLQDFESALHVSECLSKSWTNAGPFCAFLNAQTWADAGRLDEAIEQLRQLAEQESAEIPLRLQVIEELAWHERTEEALQLLNRLIESAPKDSDDTSFLLYTRFQMLKKLGRIDEAEQAWHEAKRASEGVVPSDEIVAMFVAQGNLRKALEYAEQESEPFARGKLRGIVAELMGNHEWARDEWWRVTREKYDPEDESLFDWIECALRLDDVDKAEEAIRAGVQEGQPLFRSLWYEGLVWAKRGKLDRAAEVLAFVKHREKMSKYFRNHFIMETDAWLIEQALPDPQTRQFVRDLLAGSSAQAEEAQPPASSESDVQAEGA